jgi:hypothetical protein
MQGDYFSNQQYSLYSYPQALNQPTNFGLQQSGYAGIQQQQPYQYQYQSFGPIGQQNYLSAPYQFDATNSTDESIHLIKRKLNGKHLLSTSFFFHLKSILEQKLIS